MPSKVELVAIGSSTGGPSALLNVLGSLPVGFPVPIVVSQHIADGFVPGLVNWLDAGCKIPVRVADEGAPLVPGTAYLSRTGKNLEVRSLLAHYVMPRDDQLYVPSADALFESVLREHGRRSIGVILTGMGADGAKALKRLHDIGATTIAEDESTCTVFGMPRVAIESGAVSTVLRVEAIGEEIVRLATGVGEAV
jgi:two-component system chemotaxis response regulator CheB